MSERLSPQGTLVIVAQGDVFGLMLLFTRHQGHELGNIQVIWRK